PYVSQFWRPDRTNPLAAQLFDPRQYPARRSGLVDKGQSPENDHESIDDRRFDARRDDGCGVGSSPHRRRPASSATKRNAAPTPAQPPTGQPGMGMMGDMPMMNMMGRMRDMMGDMPMMNMIGMMRMMEMMGPGMAAIDRIEGRIAFLHAELN